MQLFSSSFIFAFALLFISVALINIVQAGDCWPVARDDLINNKWTFVSQLQFQPSNPPNSYFVYSGERVYTLDKPKLKGFNGWLKKTFGKVTKVYRQTITFKVTVLKQGHQTTILNIKSTLADSSFNTPREQYRTVIALNNQKNKKVNPVYWLETADECDSFGAISVPFVAEDIKAIYVDLKLQ